MRAEEIIAEISESGSHFFDRDTMRFFNSKLEGKRLGLSCGTDSGDKRFLYFVTSERFIPSSGPSPEYPRKYTVRRWDRERKHMGEVGEFQQYSKARDARKVMYEAASERGQE